MKKESPASVNQCWIRYRNTHLPGVVDADRQQRAWKNLEPFFKTLNCDEVKPHLVKDFLDNAPGSLATKARDLGTLRAILNWNHKNDYVPGVSFVKRPVVKNPRTRVLSEDEIVRILDAIDSSCFHDFVATCFFSAQRTAAVINLTWDRVNMATGVVDFRDATLPLADRRKGRAVLPISGQLRKIFERRRSARQGEFVFQLAGRPLSGMSREFKIACRKAGVEGATLHTLRHTAATMALNNGATFEQVQKMLAHRDMRTTQENYEHLRPDFVKPALDAIKLRL